MASSDDEMEDLPESVTNYYFVDDSEEPISFSVLPVNWNTSETLQISEKKVYVRGNADGGLEKIYKPVKAWKFDISGVKPEISVLCKDNNWLKLQKPRQSFEEYIRTVLVAVNFLHLVKKKPEMHGKRVWKKLSNIFSLHDVIPSAKDLACNKEMLEQAVKQDESLKKSKCLMTFLERNPQKHRADEHVLAKGKSEFVVNDDDCSSDDLEIDSSDEEDGSGGEEDGSADEEDGEDEAFDSVCSICDEGGPLLCCEGICMRSFHATPRAGRPSKCSSLGFTEKEVQDMPYFKCENCQLKQHQCFVCGKLGSSDKQGSAQVFQCVTATCGYFYHPHCVSKLIRGKDENAAKELAEKIRAGESFTCPLHVCIICKQAEDKTNPELQMAVCRRCPKAYHKKCLPKKIAFEEDEDAGVEQRAWEGLLVDRILIYCLKHTIDDDLGTPARDHIIFPSDNKKENKSLTGGVAENKVASKKKVPSLRALPQAPPAVDPKKKLADDSDPDKKIAKRVPKLQRSNTLKKLSSEKKTFLTKTDGSSGVEERKCYQQLGVVKPTQTENLGEVECTKTSKIAVKQSVPQLDSDSERRILDLMNEASSIITLDDILAKHEKLISSRSYKQKMDPCRSITFGKVEGACQAAREAAKKIDGGSVEDAKKICGPIVLNQMTKWKSNLRVYLAPFIYGMRYTSFGRHFTKIDKLNEIVDTLHWYVNDGDMIVDFCCGANDFSWLMKQKLESRGKKCNYKNYDLFKPKNDFCFEKRDWMDVQPNELPTGSKLIMGLNPPFGVKAAKANQFINKALQFKPKLLILIVPPETERLDKKKTPYDLVWENKDKLSGKSFYLPGSVDINDKQMEDWNIVAPVLYLWSRSDWTVKHVKIAKEHQHLLGEQREIGRDSSFKIRNQSSIATEVGGASPKAYVPETPKEENLIGGGDDTEKSIAHKDHSKGKHVNAGSNIIKSKKGSKKKRHSEVIHRGGGYKKQRPSSDKHHHEVVPRPSPCHTRDEREAQTFRHQRSPSDMEISGPFEPTGYDERRHSSENFTSRHHESLSKVGIRDLVHGHPEAPSYRPGNYGNSHHQDMTGYRPQGDMYPVIRGSRWPEDHGYSHPRNHVDSTVGYVRSDVHGYGMNQYSESYAAPSSYVTSPSYASQPQGSHSRTMDKYSFNLHEPNHGRMASGSFGPDMGLPTGPGLYNHRPVPPRHAYPAPPMDFAPGPANHFHHQTSSGGWIDE